MDRTDEDAAELERAPDAPRDKPYTQKGPGYTYYCSLRDVWLEWWLEFTTEFNLHNGQLKYPTIKSFINSKAKTQQRRRWLMIMLGPEPQIDPNKKRLECPWLGDWIQRRKLLQLSRLDPTKLETLRKQWDNIQDRQLAARSAAPVIIRQLALYEEFQDSVKEAFAGMPFMPNRSPHGAINKLRSQLYFRRQTQATKNIVNLIHEWYTCVGYNPDLMVSVEANPYSANPMQPVATPPDGKVIEGQTTDQVVDGHQVRQVLLPQGCTVDDMLLARMIRDKAKQFSMKLPAGLEKGLDPISEDEVKTAKKKVQ